MTRDDIETYEARIQDRALFNNLALILLSASIPLGIEKVIEYFDNESAVALAIVVVCGVATIGGVAFGAIAWHRRQRVDGFKDRLFREERKIATMLSVVDSQSSAPSDLGIRAADGG
ncbi:MAG: hypothetical protein RIM84_26095 [Alphaproteobacteria bacterium]